MLSNQESQWDVAFRFFLGISSKAAVGSRKGDHNPCLEGYGFTLFSDKRQMEQFC